MRTISVAFGALLLASSAVVPSADAQPSYRWHITKDHWTQGDEAGFGKFVQAIGDSNCDSTETCVRSAANPYRDTDPRGMDIDADCAKFVYFLRAYYASKNGLPFSFVSGVSGSGSDLRFSKDGNRAVARHDFTDHGDGIDGPAAMYAVLGSVSSATYRQPADEDKGVLPDFYSPKISPQTIHPGTVLYDINGHAAIVYRVDQDGRIHYMGAAPDFSVSRDVYGAQFGQPPVKLGGGFKAWRPFVLAGAKRDEAGHLIGGHFQFAHNQDIPNYSLEQYEGTKGNRSGDLKDARWDYNGVDLGYYEYVRVAVSGGEMSFNPIYEFKLTMRNLCKEFKDRAASVQQATENGISGKPHPASLPENIYTQADTTWESYATPKRDARIKAIFAQSRKDLANMLELWRNRDPRIVYDGLDLKADLETVYNDETKTCSITYLNSAQEPVSLTFDQLVDRLYLMSFDPYDCVEHRWGAAGAEASTCKDGDDKQRWYTAEQPYRNQIDPDPMENTGLSLAELEHKRQKQVQVADVDLKSLIDDIGPRVAFNGMTPIGR